NGLRPANRTAHSFKQQQVFDSDFISPMRHFSLICESDVTIISGLPRYKVIFPDTPTIRPSYCCGLRNFEALRAVIEAVNAWFGYVPPCLERCCLCPTGRSE